MKPKHDYRICICCTFLTFVLFFVIGLPFFLAGCNKNVSTNCIAYNVVKGTFYDSKVEQTECGNKIRYTCYDVYAYAHYDADNRTCTVLVEEGQENKYRAIRIANSYLGDTDDLYQSKISLDKCFLEDGEIVHFWYTGVVFLSAAGLFLLAATTFYWAQFRPNKVPKYQPAKEMEMM